MIERIRDGTGAANGAGAFLPTGFGNGAGKRSGNCQPSGISTPAPVDYPMGFGDLKVNNYGYGNSKTACDMHGDCEPANELGCDCNSFGRSRNL